MKKGRLIVIDGVDGCGKGTQIKLLKEKYLDAIFTREPGGTPEAEKIREEIFNTERDDKTPERDFELFWKSRKIHVSDLLIPSLEEGKLIFSDRLDSSTFAYQICGEENLSFSDDFFKLHKELIEPLEPVYIILDLSPEESHERMKNDYVRTPNRFDEEPLEYHKRVREGFAKFKEEVSDVYFVDASPKPGEIHQKIVDIVESNTN